MQLVEILKSVELFRGLNAGQLERLVAISREEAYQSDQVIFSQGSQGDKVYIIAHGQVEISVAGGRRGSHVTIYLGQGQIFGEMALLDQTQRSATVTAMEPNTVVYAISNQDFMRLCAENTALGFVMMRNMAMDLSFKLRHQNLDPSAGLTV